MGLEKVSSNFKIPMVRNEDSVVSKKKISSSELAESNLDYSTSGEASRGAKDPMPILAG